VSAGLVPFAALVALWAATPDAGGLLPAPVGASASAAPASAARPAQGPPPDVAMTCAPETVKVGQPLLCTLTAVHPDTVSVVVPLPSGAVEAEPESAGGEPAAVTRTRPDGRLETIRRFVLRALEPKASLRVPAFELTWVEATGGEGRLEVPARKIPIERLLPGEDDPRPRTFAAPPSEAAAFVQRLGPVAFRTTNWFALIATAVVVAGALGLGLGWLVKRWLDARRRAAMPVVDTRPAHVIALEKLELLDREHLPEQGLAKAYYFRLSEIVRDYLERRYSFGALEMTSDEIRTHLAVAEAAARSGARGTADAAVTAEGRRAVEAFLDETDLVKFADFAPTESAAETVMRAARGIIALTRAPDVSSVAPTAPAPAKPTETRAP
jgi:hypothetical protein